MQAPVTVAQLWLNWMLSAMKCHGVSTKLRQAAFLAQAGHESDGFHILSENMNYNADRLLEIFPKHFTLAQAGAYARNPEQIANRVYANRMGNGDEASGDGWKFRGGGIFQLTGRNDYRAFGQFQGLDFEAEPDRVRVPGWVAAMSAGWEWERSKMNALADLGNIDAVSKRLNGGSNGLDDRRRRYAVALKALSA